MSIYPLQINFQDVDFWSLYQKSHLVISPPVNISTLDRERNIYMAHTVIDEYIQSLSSDINPKLKDIFEYCKQYISGAMSYQSLSLNLNFIPINEREYIGLILAYDHMNSTKNLMSVVKGTKEAIWKIHTFYGD